MANVLIAIASFGLLGFGAADLRTGAIFVICLVLAIGVHEFAHAWAATKLGDPTAQAQGRLTLNPIAHADPIGTLLLPIVLVFSGTGMLFGWGRPVPFNAQHFTRKVTMRGGTAIVAAAGPLSNLVQAALTLAVVWGLYLGGVLSDPLGGTHPLRVFFSLNILLFAFNLLPLHPLDGGKVLQWVMGPKYQHIDDFLLRYGGIILIVLIVALPQVLHFLLGPFFQFGNWALYQVMV